MFRLVLIYQSLMNSLKEDMQTQKNKKLLTPEQLLQDLHFQSGEQLSVA